MADRNNLDIASLETFFGAVTSIACADDALLLVEAVRLGAAPRLHRRLTENQQLLIRSGSVFVWNEGETKIKRWTDGRHWSNSRMKGRFFLYKELAASKKTGTARARVSVAAAATTFTSADQASSSASTTATTTSSQTTSAASATALPTTSPRSPTSDDVSSQGLVSQTDASLAASPPPAGADAATIPAVPDRIFLRKKTISFQTRQGEKYHLIAYYHGQSETSMSRPSQVAGISDLVIDPGFYFTGLDMTPLMLSINNPTANLAEQSPTGPASASLTSPSFAAAPTQQSTSPSLLPTPSQANLPNAVEETPHSPVLAASRALQSHVAAPTVNPSRVIPQTPIVAISRSPYPLRPSHDQAQHAKGDDMRRRDSWAAPDGRDHRDYPQYSDQSRSSHSLPVSHRDMLPHYSHSYGAVPVPDAPPTSWPGQPYPPPAQYHTTTSGSRQQPSASPTLSHPATTSYTYRAPPPVTASAWQPIQPYAPLYYQVAPSAHAYSAASNFIPYPAHGYYPHPPHSGTQRGDAVQYHHAPETDNPNQEARSMAANEAGGAAESGCRSEDGLTVDQQMHEEGQAGE